MRFGIKAVPFAATLAALTVAALALVAGAAPCQAAFGALAYDDTAGKYGLSSDQETQSKADEAALKSCGGEKCKIVFRTAARECGAVATADTGNAWGAGKQAERAAADLRALQNCQKRTKGQCKVRDTKCNK